MIQQRILHGLKIIIIILLVMAISMLVILRWKSDMIIDKVLSSVQHELVDSLQYTTADMNWFSHFPLISIQIYDLNVGSGKSIFIAQADVAIVIGLFPLLKNQINVNELGIKDGTVYIHRNQGRWSYDILKKKENKSEEVYSTKIRQLVIENVMLEYEDSPTGQVSLAIEKGVFKGGIEANVLEADFNLTSTLNKLAFDGYSLPEPFTSNFSGAYEFDFGSDQQLFKGFQLEHNAIHLLAEGSMKKDTIDLALSWEKTDPAQIQKWLPEKFTSAYQAYQISGEMEGQSKIEGVLSKKENLNIDAAITLKNGAINFLKTKEEVKGIDVDLTFTNGLRVTGEKPKLQVAFEKSGKFGKAFKGQLDVTNLQNPVFDLTFDGTLAASLLNLMEIPELDIEQGTLEIDHLKLNNIQSSTFSLNTLFSQGMESVNMKDLRLTYQNNALEINEGSFHLADNSITIGMENLVWNKAKISALEGLINSKEHQLEYEISGKLCEGAFSTTGRVTGLNKRPSIISSWKVSGIAMDQLLQSFSNFDQTFITSENLSGKTNLWVESNLPFDEKWNLLSNQMVVKSAIDIREGRLHGMQAFEEFSKFVDLEDLRDIRFNQIRNYMLIEKGKVFLPVMFIQSSAVNLSISGEHGFDEEIIYFLKLNAGQIAANKLKKNQKKSDYVKASKSGWINMYFALSGTTENPRYQQYKKAVIAGFEQSTKIKEKLRDELVEKFGYDVYWLEPNEWEDIPEYQ